MRCRLPIPIKTSVKGKFLGVGEHVCGSIIAFESYEGCVPTFTWLSSSGHLFCFLPPHAFGQPEVELGDCVDFSCPSGSIDVADLAIEGPGHGRVGSSKIAWKRYVATVDWIERNELGHVCIGHDDQIIFLRNARFQVGGDSYDPPSWKKSRETWKLP